MEEPKIENKLFNVFLLGDIKSEKNIIQQYLLSNNQQKEKPKEENNISEPELTQSFEIHGETIKMKILEVPKLDQIFSSENENSPQTHGILLFYSVSDRDSFDKLKQMISKIIDMNKYEMPIVLVGNNSDESQRKVPFDEAKKFSDNYGLKYHEISMENNDINMKDIFKDLGEQVLYQENLEKSKSSDKKGKNEKIENKKNITKSKSKADLKDKKTVLQKKREDEVREKRMKREKEMQLWYKKRERESIELKKKKAIEDKIKLIEKIKEDKIIQKQREKEVKEEFLNEKKEKYEKSKKEKEEGEKKYNLEKEKNKLLLEKKRKSEKENLKKLLLENEQNDKEYIKQKRLKIHSPQSSKTRQRNQNNNEQNSIFTTISEFDNKEKDIKNQTMTNFYSSKNVNTDTKNTNTNVPKKDKNEKKLVKSKSYRKTSKNQNKNEIEKSEQKLQEIKNNMEEIERKEREEKEREEKEKEEKLLQEQIKLQNDLKEKYLNNNCNIYRCIYCHEIPIININEFNHQIEIYCNNCKNKNHNIDNNYILAYQNFEEKSLDHPIDKNINCFYCKKNIDELNNENLYLNFCDICNDVLCSSDAIIHKNQKHSNFKDLKEKYKNLLQNINLNNKKNEEKPKDKKNKTKNNIDSKNKLLTPAKSQASLRRGNNSPKKDKNQKEDKKAISNKKNIPISNNKKENKKVSDKNKNAEKINVITSSEEKEKNINKIPEEKLPIYLVDSCCIEHGKIYSNYCHDCLMNICDACGEKEHKNHNLEKLNDILVDDEKISEIKNALEKDINDLDNINNYFNQLIEKIKEQYTYFYSLKKKEIEIKQKIIKDYETIKYNYNTIQNVCNINYKNIINNKESIISNLDNFNNNSTDDALSNLNLIFNYLNDSTQKTNLIKYYNNINNYFLENGLWEITDIIQLDKNHIALSYFDGCIYIYDNSKFKLKLLCKVFDNNKGINQMIQLRNGDLACCGYEKIKILNVNLDNKVYNIINEINIKNGSFTLVKELRNNYLITYDTNNKLKIWYKYKLIYVENNNIDIDYLLKIKENLFISSSHNDNKRQLNLFNVNIENNNSIKLNSFSLDNTSVIKQKNPIIKINNNYIVALVSYEEEKLDKKDASEKFEESKNNEENYDNGICLIEINKNQLKIIHNIKNKIENGKYIHIINYINNSFLVLNDLCDIELWSFDNINTKITILNKLKVLDNIYNNGINNVLVVEENGEIILQCCNNLVCLSHK